MFEMNMGAVGDHSIHVDLKKITDEELKSRLLAHERWLQGNRNRADQVDLSELDLRGVDLSGARLECAYMAFSNLEQAKLIQTDLSHAFLAHANFDGACLVGVNLTEAFLVNARMVGADFHHCCVIREGKQVIQHGKATLRKARMAGAILSRANFSGSDLSGADIENADLTGASLVGADLPGAIVQHSDLTDASLVAANLAGADFRGSSLHNTDLKMTNLDNANLRNCRGKFFLNDTSIRGTRFSTRAADPYSKLRRTYTGPMFFLILLLTILAFLPYVLKALAWSYVGIIESKSDAYLNEKIARLGNQHAPDDIAEVRDILNRTRISGRDDFTATSVLSIVIGWEEKNRLVAVSMTAMLLLYSLIRGWLTLQMSGLRDAEERSQHSPERREYEILFYIHSYFLTWFMHAAFLIAGWNVINSLLTVVYIPAP